MAHPNLIPEEWKQDEKGRARCTFFWGTIYRCSDGDLCVRCLCWDDGKWRRGYFWLDDVWYVRNPAALREVRHFGL